MTITYTHKKFTIVSDYQMNRQQLDHLVQGFQFQVCTAGSALGGRCSVTKLNLEDIGPVVIKHFRRGGLLANFIHRTYLKIGKTRGQHEFEQMKRIQKLGVKTPETAAFAWKGRLFYNAWLVTHEILSVKSMAQVNLLSPSRAASALNELARQVSILINNGILHADFHPGNVLIDDRDRVFLIDLDKAGTYRGGKAALESKYCKRWRRAIQKHRLPSMLYNLESLVDLNCREGIIAKSHSNGSKPDQV